MATKKHLDDLSYKVLGCAIEVHKQLGPALLESIYEICLAKELSLRGVKFQTQVSVPIVYKGVDIEAKLRLDMLIEDIFCVELKAQEGLLPIHDAVLLSYMQMLQKPKGLLINFHCTNIFKFGQKNIGKSLVFDVARRMS